MKTRTTLIPQYMKDFQCIGLKCEDNCCYGWKVSIDDVTYKKYRKVNEPSLKFRVSSSARLQPPH